MSRRNRARKSLEKARRTLKLTFDQLENRTLLAADFASNEIIVQYKFEADELGRAEIRNLTGATVSETIHSAAMILNGTGVMERLTLPAGLSVETALQRLAHNPNIVYAEPNWVYHTEAVSNDTYYTNGQLWGMYGDDLPSAVGPAGTTNQYGSQAEKAWNNGFTGSNSVYVGIIDEGFQYAHPDLDANSWTNTFDPIDGIDNDGNGYIDDVHGWDFFSNDNTTYDGTADDHGTHVAGTIGGEGGNAAGVAGVNWSVTMISTKFLGPTGGYTSGAVQALDYLTDLKVRHGLNIVASNNSWGGGGYSQALLDAIVRAANQGILFVAAAGNSNSNNDATSSYPSNYSTVGGSGYEAVVAVASITSTGTKSSFSSYGATTVDLGAPGSSIVSTVPSNTYASYSGTSMATPHVTGAIALYASKYPGTSADDIRSAILASARPTSSMAGLTVTGGRLDVDAALAISPPGGSVPNIGISDVSVTEGNGTSTTSAVFTVSLSAASSQTVTVNFGTANGSATGGVDFDSNSGTLTFLPGGPLTQTVTVVVRGDDASEGNENYFVNLSGASNANITDSQGVGTIVDDDQPTMAISNVSASEGKRNTRVFNFTVSLSAPASSSISVNYATADGTANAGSDYAARSGTLIIPVGASSGTIGINVYGDSSVEPDETFLVYLSAAVGAVIVDSQGVGTILNDDRSRLLVAGPVVTDSAFRGGVSNRDLTALLNEAQSRWIAAGETTLNDLQALHIQIRSTNLPGRTLGMAEGNTIWIDRNAAGYGWFIDSTPQNDFEFASPTALNRVDLLSVISHELGHLMGFDHDDDHAGMQPTLSPGERHAPAPAIDLSVVGSSIARSVQGMSPSQSPGGITLPTSVRSSSLPATLLAIAPGRAQNSLRAVAGTVNSVVINKTALAALDRVFANELRFLGEI